MHYYSPIYYAYMYGSKMTISPQSTAARSIHRKLDHACSPNITLSIKSKLTHQ